MNSPWSAGLIKLIRVQVRAGHRSAYLEAQAVWNRESTSADGYLGECVGDGEEGEVYVLTFWRSRGEYERWMEGDHDRIAALAEADQHYEALEAHLIDCAGATDISDMS